jgi:hypothetical protein
MPDDPTRRATRPIDPVWPAPASGAVTFHQVWVNSGVLCLECRQCNKRTALTKADLPASRLGNIRYVLHASFKCSKCSADQPRCTKRRWPSRKCFWRAIR